MDSIEYALTSFCGLEVPEKWTVVVLAAAVWLGSGWCSWCLFRAVGKIHYGKSAEPFRCPGMPAWVWCFFAANLVAMLLSGPVGAIAMTIVFEKAWRERWQ